ncbi:MAG: hypothetical protein EOP61_07385 [Sphingomonadales bacterium]|nr:MAG: hypothetical protein EOP61_07385 [Sphingomonadales bacterium]
MSLLFVAASIFYIFAALGICAFALIRGGRDERAVAAGYLVAAAASWIAADIQNVRYHEPQYLVMVVDLCFLAFLLLIVQRSRRFWPLWVAAAHLVGTFTHVVRILQSSMLAEAYASVQPFWAFPMLFALAVGTFHNRNAATARN